MLITTPPTSTVTAGSTFGFTVTAVDAEGNVATGFNGSETVALASNPGSSTLGGTLTISAVRGVATFSNLTLNLVDSGYTLAVSSSTLSSVSSSAISVMPGAATQLLIATQPPSTVTAGSEFGFTVMAEDSLGNVATGFTGSETVALAGNPGTSTLGGTLTIPATSGIGVFSSLDVEQIRGWLFADRCQRHAHCGHQQCHLDRARAATSFALSATPVNLTAGSTAGITITAEDAFNNLVLNFTDSLTLSDSLSGVSMSGRSRGLVLGRDGHRHRHARRRRYAGNHGHRLD